MIVEIIVPVFNSDFKNLRDILQPIMATHIECDGKGHKMLTLSDTGSTIAFLVKGFAEKLNMTPAGGWEGMIETLYSVQKVVSKFYKIRLVLADKTTRVILGLECDSLGGRPALPPPLVEAVCKEFNYDAKNIFQSGGRITLLLGQDTQSLLLEKLPNLRKSSNPAFRDVSIQGTAASSMASIVGALGLPAPSQAKGKFSKLKLQMESSLSTVIHVQKVLKLPEPGLTVQLKSENNLKLHYLHA